MKEKGSYLTTLYGKRINPNVDDENIYGKLSKIVVTSVYNETFYNLKPYSVVRRGFCVIRVKKRDKKIWFVHCSG